MVDNDTHKLFVTVCILLFLWCNFLSPVLYCRPMNCKACQLGGREGSGERGGGRREIFHLETGRTQVIQIPIRENHHQATSSYALAAHLAMAARYGRHGKIMSPGVSIK